LTDFGLDVAPDNQRTPEALRAFHKAETELWWPVIRLPAPSRHECDRSEVNASNQAQYFRYWQIVLKNSEIAVLRKSRTCRLLAISAAARLCRIDTSASGRFCDN